MKRARRAIARNPLRAALVLAATAIAAIVVFSGGGGGTEPASAGGPRQLLDSLGRVLPDVRVVPRATSPARGPSFRIARLRTGAEVPLRDAPEPDGRPVAKLSDTTEFGSPRTFYVAEQRGGWLGVVATEMPNGRFGWLRDDPAQIETYRTGITVEANLSLRLVTVRYGKKVIKRLPVTIGAAGSSTPEGTFSVTDGLAGPKLGPYYGCCVLALSGHQPNLPPGWIGGDRIAIHGTPGPVGVAASAGCLRASDHDMVALFALVPLGAPVFIHS